MAEVSFVTLPSEMNVDRQQAVAWANIDVDLCCHMASLDHIELRKWIFHM